MSIIKTFNEHRRNSNSTEEKIYQTACKWDKENSVIFDQAILGSHSTGRPKNYLTDHEKSIVFTTLQWLGSPVGQSFLSECGFEQKESK